MGRTKLESIELDDDVKPENAHVARTVVEDEEGEEMEILRHSLPYGDGRGDQGLFFIAYTKDLSIIDAMLKRMFGTSGDGIHDRLLHFVTPLDGAYYFAPSEELLEEILVACKKKRSLSSSFHILILRKEYVYIYGILVSRTIDQSSA